MAATMVYITDTYRAVQNCVLGRMFGIRGHARPPKAPRAAGQVDLLQNALIKRAHHRGLLQDKKQKDRVCRRDEFLTNKNVEFTASITGSRALL